MCISLVLFGHSLMAQTKTIGGTVTDTNGMPLPGANIVVQQTGNGAQTDFDGNYTISVEKGQTLVFSYVGFTDVKRVVKDDDLINITMEEDFESLEDVVITAFGRKMTKNESTASVSTVSGDDVEKTPYADAMEGLKGKIAGVSINSNSGVPGSMPTIRIRGVSSLNADTQPLYVIDGVPVNSEDMSNDPGESTSMSPLALIDPADIESMSILKDASAVAPYGADGANGVILITTKSGKNREKTSYSLSYSLGIINPAMAGFKVLNAEQRADAILQGAWNSYGASPTGLGLFDSKDQAEDFVINELGRSDYQQWLDRGRPNANWKELVRHKDAISHQVNFSMVKGSGGSNMYTSIGYNKTEGTIIGSSFERMNGSLKYDTQLNDKMNLNLSTRVSNAVQNGIMEYGSQFDNPILSSYFLNPWKIPYKEDGSINFDDFNTQLVNPIYTQEHNMLRSAALRGMFNGSFDYEIVKDLTFKTVLGADFMRNSYKRYLSPVHGPGVDPHGRAFESRREFFSYTSQNSLDYNFTLSDQHHFNVTALQEYSRFEFSGLRGSGENFPSDENLKNLSASTKSQTANSNFSNRMNMRWVGMVNYNFDYKYLINASYSYQGDSRFTKHYGSFYSIGLGWNVQEEDFLKDVDFVDDMRIRAGYGETGNAGIRMNSFQELVNIDKYNEQPARTLSNYGSNITWEKSKRADVGLQFELFKRRLSGGFSYYHNQTADMLFNVPLPPSATYLRGSVLQNVGSMLNTGIEVELGVEIVKTEDVKWNFGFNVGTVKNKLTDIPEESETIADEYAIAKGHELKEWYLRDWAGVDPDNGLPLWYVDKTQGDETTSDYSKAKRRFQGSGFIPKYTGSFNTSVNVKQFSLSAELFFSGGNKFYEGYTYRRYLEDMGSFALGTFNTNLSNYEGAWQEPGDQATAPRFDFTDGRVANYKEHSTRFLHDGEFVRLRSVAVGYTVDKDFVQKMGLEALTLAVRGTNLWTWLKDDTLDLDPEPARDGIINMVSPPVKTITLNVNLKF